MSDAFTALETAIDEVTKTREALKKRHSTQVHAADEVQRVKSVAYAWLKNHRPDVQAHGSNPDLTGVNSAYTKIMDATAKHSARTTYLSALKAAKTALVQVRSIVALASTPNTPETPPNFAPLAVNPTMQAILNRRWNEVQLCIGCKAYLAATVMMGGLLETLLLARINSSPKPAAIFTAQKAPKDKAGKTKPLSDWKLIEMVEVSQELTWITKSAKDVGNVLRDFRNYIHPHKEFTDAVVLGVDDTRMFWEVTKAIARQVLTSVGKSP
jgi:hypothetical protein